MSDISNIVEAISYASASASGKEHQFLEYIKNYMTTQDPYYAKKAQKLYKRLGYSSQARMDRFYNAIAEYYG